MALCGGDNINNEADDSDVSTKNGHYILRMYGDELLSSLTGGIEKHLII